MDKDLLLTMVESVIEDVDSIKNDIEDLEDKPIKELHSEIHGYRNQKGILNYMSDLAKDLEDIYDYINKYVKEEEEE